MTHFTRLTRVLLSLTLVGLTLLGLTLLAGCYNPREVRHRREADNCHTHGAGWYYAEDSLDYVDGFDGFDTNDHGAPVCIHVDSILLATEPRP